MSAIIYPLLLVCLILVLNILSDLENKKNLLDNIKDESNDVCQYDIGQVWTYDYTGSEQEFSVPCNGIYKIELWGAQGGSISGIAYNSDETTIRNNSITYTGGKGAYTSGNIKLIKNNKIYLYVGGTPSRVNTTLVSGTDIGGYNGGANLTTGQGIFGAPGGGATDVRLVNGTWDNFNSLKSRIMVAAGGGGANFRNQGYGEGNGGEGGTLTGLSGYEALTAGSYFRSDYAAGYNIGTGGSQTSGGYEEEHLLNGTVTTSRTEGRLGHFGTGANGNQSGGGGGYYGGGSNGHGGAGGGSSFISGYSGCNAITESSTSSNIVHTGQSNHYSGYIFTDSQMIAGNASMPTYSGTNTMTGNTGSGYAKITLIGTNTSSSVEIVKSGAIKVEASSTDTHKGIIYLDPTDLTKECNASNSISTTGTKTGCMKWYIYDDSGTSYKLLLDHNTTARIKWNDDNKNVSYEESNLYSVVEDLKTTSRWIVSPRIITAEEVNTITGKTGFNVTNANSWYYLDTLTQIQNTFSETKRSSYDWLYNNLNKCRTDSVDLGCSIEDNNSYSGYGTAENGNTWAYWTSTAVGTASFGTNIWFIGRDGHLGNDNATRDNFGIRPVITISKSIIK